jgi:hypothetical protein
MSTSSQRRATAQSVSLGRSNSVPAWTLLGDGVEDLLLLLRGRSTYYTRAAEVEEVAVERSVQIETDHVAGLPAFAL